MTRFGIAEPRGRSARAPERVGRPGYVTCFRGELFPTLAAINRTVHHRLPHRDPVILRRALEGLRSL